MEENFGNFVPKLGPMMKREIILYQTETPPGTTVEYIVENLRISEANNLVMDSGETGLLCFHPTDEMKKTPDGERAANALGRLVRDSQFMEHEHINGSAKNLTDFIVSVNVEATVEDKALMLRIFHHETKGRAFNFLWV